MWFGLVTKHACDRWTDGQTDKIMTPKTVLAWLCRATKTMSSTRPRCWIQISTVDVINIAADRQKFMTLTGELSWQRLIRSAVPGILVKNRGFNLPHLSLAGPRWGWPRLNFAEIFGIRKLEWLPFRVVEKYRQSVLWISHKARVWQTDRETDGQTELRLLRPR